MKKLLSTILVLAMIFSLGMAYPAKKVVAATETRTDIGSYDITRFNGLWDNPSSNVVLLITPGSSLAGMYYNKLYAEYDSTKECYIVKEKVWNLRNLTNAQGGTFVVPENGIGLLFNYAPLSDINNERLREMWMTWQQVKVGDEIRLSDVDVANKTFGASPKASFTAVRNPDDVADTPLTGKTIVALGDSITVGGGWTEDLEDFFGCRVVNAGMGGDTAAGALASRFDMLVPQHDPDIVIISYGINDCLAARLDKPTLKHIEDYKANMKKLYDKATAIGAKVVFQNANNIKVKTYEDSHNQDGRFAEFGGVQGYLDLWEQSLKDLARELNVPLVDLYNMWRQELPNDAEGIATYLVDTVHPNDKGFDKNMEVIINSWGGEVIIAYCADLSKADGCKAVVEDGVIKNIPEGTTAKELMDMFLGNWGVYRDGERLNDADAVKTGDCVSLQAIDGDYTIGVYIEVGNYTVKFAATEGGTISATDSLSLPYGTKVSDITFPTATANEGYRFARWYVSDSIVSENMIIVAEFEKIEHTVTFVAGEGGTLFGNTTAKVLDGTLFSALPFPTPKPRAGYKFVKWEKNVEGTKVKSDVTVTAIFEKEITYTYGDVDENGTINAADASLVLQYNVQLKDLSESQMKAAELNSDNKVNAADATLILMYNVQLINKFPVEG